MSAPPEAQGEAVTSKQQLIDYLASGSRPAEEWSIGTEHEKFAFTRDDLKPLPYDGPRGIRALLEGMAERFGWEPVYEHDRPIALKKAGCNITLEPGGQVELSGAQLQNIHQTCDEVHTHLAQIKEVCEPLDIGMIGLGFAPTWQRGDMPWMPKGRYEIMGNYMPKKGNLGLDMMLRTCTVQVNLDFSSEADMVRKFRVSLALQPIATALFANSPFTEGKPNGFLSYRSHIWTDTDPDRCGVPSFVFEEGMSFERYVDYVLDVPMYFIYRDGAYLDVSGQSFRDFMEGRLPGRPGERPFMSDWSDHLTTLFPEVRLKRFLEMRGADGGPWRRLCALPAFWVGMLYDAGALSAAESLIADWTMEDHAYLRAEVPRLGLKTPFRGGRVLDVAREALKLSQAGLTSRGVLDGQQLDERNYLKALWEIVDSGTTPAEVALALYETEWDGDVSQIFRRFEY